jgi:hypothetical protein
MRDAAVAMAEAYSKPKERHMIFYNAFLES